MKVFNMRESLSGGPRKRNLDYMKKYICTKLRQLVEVEVVPWIGLRCRNHNYPPFWNQKLTVLDKTHRSIWCECRKLCTATNAAKGVEKREPSYTVGGNETSTAAMDNSVEIS